MENLLVRFNWIDGEIPRPIANQKAVDAIAVRLGEPGPHESIAEIVCTALS
jgi:hypothetical protein